MLFRSDTNPCLWLQVFKQGKQVKIVEWLFGKPQGHAWLAWPEAYQMTRKFGYRAVVTQREINEFDYQIGLS